MVIKSTPRNHARRQAIRETWGGGGRFNLVFILGIQPDKNPSAFQEVEHHVIQESLDFGDILRGNFDESFLNLTLKEKLWIKWFTNFCGSNFIFKGDDDIMVNPFVLGEHIV